MKTIKQKRKRSRARERDRRAKENKFCKKISTKRCQIYWLFNEKTQIFASNLFENKEDHDYYGIAWSLFRRKNKEKGLWRIVKKT